MKTCKKILEGLICKYPKSTYGGYYSRFYIALRDTGSLPDQKVMMKIQSTEFPTRLTTNGKQTFVPMPRSLVKRLRPCEGEEVRVEILNRLEKNRLFEAVWKKGTNYFLDLKIAIPKQSYNGYRITILEFPNDFLRVFYKTITRNPKPVTIPRYLPLSQENFEVMGLAQGELLKCVRKGLLSLSNSDPVLINCFLDLCERIFQVKRIDWRASLAISRLSSSEEVETELKKFWSKKVSISPENFVKTHFHRYGQQTPYGTLHVYVSNILLTWLMAKLLTFCAKLASLKTEWAAAFMRGVFAADGCPILRSNNALLSADIAHNPKTDEARLYVSLLSKLDIKAKIVPPRTVKIQGVENFLKLGRFGLFRLHGERQKKFSYGLKAHREVKSLLRLKALLKQEVTVKQLAKLLSISNIRSQQLLKRWFEASHVTRSRGGPNRDGSWPPYSYRLTEKGLRTLAFLSSCLSNNSEIS